MSKAAPVPAFKLNNGTLIPSVGMGCWMGTPGEGERAYNMCLNALKHGYRHFDTASGYANEEMVGKAIKDSGIPREEIYVVTKLPNDGHDKVREAFEESLKKLGTYIDLYLMHWPQATRKPGSHGWQHGASSMLRPDEHPTFNETWKDMEKLLETGKVKSIGVSNFSIRNLEKLLSDCTVVPANNQVELHPYLPFHDLKEFCDKKGITVTAYSPLGRSQVLMKDPVITSIAESNKITPAQVLLSWCVQRDVITIPKSENEERMKANITLHKLSDDEMAKINALHKEPGKHRSLLSYHKDGSIFGWTYEELGFPFEGDGFVKAS